MKFRVEREVLGEAVSWVARALPTRPVVPVLSGLLLRGRRRRADAVVLRLRGVGQGRGARRGRRAGDRAGARTAAGRDHQEPAARRRRGHQRRRHGDADLRQCRVRAGRAAARGVSRGCPSCPRWSGTVDGGALATAAAQVVPSASRDDTLPMLTGVCMDFDGDKLTLAATDRYRLGGPHGQLGAGRPGGPGVGARAGQDAGRRRQDDGPRTAGNDRLRPARRQDGAGQPTG